MNTLSRFAIASAFWAGIGSGVPVATFAMPAAAQKLAPASDTAFVLIEYDVTDAANFKEVASKVRGTLKDFKGEFVMREKVDSLFGGTPSNLSVISFPTVEDAKKWLASPALASLKPDREKVARRRVYLVERIGD